MALIATFGLTPERRSGLMPAGSALEPDSSCFGYEIIAQQRAALGVDQISLNYVYNS